MYRLSCWLFIAVLMIVLPGVASFALTAEKPRNDAPSVVIVYTVDGQGHIKCFG